ncbi:MAG: di-heme oxidoredictase family protein, partial [Pseudomonadota bacterium]
EATTFKFPNRDAFSQPSANMAFERQLDFRIGNGIFKKVWVSSPSSTQSSDGLGPLFNARSCQRCHLKDGRGHPPEEGETAVSMFLRLSIPPQTGEDREALATYLATVVPEPSYGGQLQNFSIQGHKSEGEMEITYTPKLVVLADGTEVVLRAPTYDAANLNYGPMHPDVMMSPRVAPPMIGLGLLEAIKDEDILANADPDDVDGDGISGRANLVFSVERNDVALGRFGWKAGEPTVAQQSAGAFHGDIGISTPIFTSHFGDCREGAQDACRSAPHGGTADSKVTEAAPDMFDRVVFYSRNLAVPARRDIDDPQVLAGKEQFYNAGCISCHTPKFVTRRDSISEEQSFQLIWPYSDLLLHDMGDGLADNRPEGVANGREWRTPPLWGIGLTQAVNGHTQFLHDGRARNLLEAILWHGGEAQSSRDAVVEMDTDEREALLAFLNSL